MQKAILILAILLLAQLPGLADEGTMTKLLGVASGATDISDVRGVKGGKALGFYFNKANLVFRSGYEKQPAKTMAEFAYNLQEFNRGKGGGYANYAKFKQEWEDRRQKQIDDAKAKGEPEAVILAIKARQLDPTNQNNKNDPYNPWARAHVSYDDQKDFAEKWWQGNKAYDDAVMKDWWINDAILDANNLWAAIDTAYADPAEARTYYEHQLRHLLKKH